MADEANAAAPGAAGGKPDGESQQPSPGGSDDSKTKPDEGNAKETVSRAELDKTIGERQAAKDRARKAEERATQAETELARRPDPESDEFKAYEAWREDRDAAETKAAIEQGDADKLVQKAREPLQKQNEELVKERDGYKGQLTALLRDRGLEEAATRAGALNPKQVAALLRHRVKMVRDDTGQFAPTFMDEDGGGLFDADGPVTDMQKFVAAYLGLPENANLVKATAAPGSGAKPEGGGAPAADGIPQTLAEFNKLTPEQRRDVAARMTKPQRDAMLGQGAAAGIL